MLKILLLSILFAASFGNTLAFNCSNFILTTDNIARNFNLSTLIEKHYSIEVQDASTGLPTIYNFSICGNLGYACISNNTKDYGCLEEDSASACVSVTTLDKANEEKYCFKSSDQLPEYTAFNSSLKLPMPHEGILFKYFFAKKEDQDQKSPIISVYILCDEKEVKKPNISIEPLKKKPSADIFLYHTAGCPIKFSTRNTLSTGSKMLIALFTAVLAYLFIGIVLNHFSGASGLDLIPNYKFWHVTLLSLVVDGLAYIRGTYKPAYVSVQ